MYVNVNVNVNVNSTRTACCLFCLQVAADHHWTRRRQPHHVGGVRAPTRAGARAHGPACAEGIPDQGWDTRHGCVVMSFGLGWFCRCEVFTNLSVISVAAAMGWGPKSSCTRVGERVRGRGVGG